MTDFAQRRTVMVDTQVRPSDVTSFPIIDAMLAVPRERFVPDALRETAYAEANLPLGQGRVVLAPRTLAKILEELDIQNDELVLDIGAGLGYSSAVIARTAEAVVAVEEDASLAADAVEALAAADTDNAAVLEGPLSAGSAPNGPYDVILLQGAIEELPAAIADQLKDGGRIAAIFMQGALGTCKIGLKVGGRIDWRFAFNATAPVLPGFEAARDFAL